MTMIQSWYIYQVVLNVKCSPSTQERERKKDREATRYLSGGFDHLSLSLGSMVHSISAEKIVHAAEFSSSRTISPCRMEKVLSDQRTINWMHQLKTDRRSFLPPAFFLPSLSIILFSWNSCRNNLIYNWLPNANFTTEETGRKRETEREAERRTRKTS